MPGRERGHDHPMPWEPWRIVDASELDVTELVGAISGRGALPDGQTYQLWAIVGAGDAQHAISAGVLGSNPSATAFPVSGAPQAFVITVEQAPGVVRSTQSPVAAGKVAA